MDWNWGPCAQRSHQLEWLDMPQTTDDEISRMFDFMWAVHVRLGSIRCALEFFKKCSRHWDARQSISILDLDAGRGDVSCAVADWGKKNGFDIHVLSVERFGRLSQLAKEKHGTRPDVTFDVRDISDSLFRQAEQFDYVMSFTGLHHYETHAVVPTLKSMNLLAKQGILVFDLLRDARALALMKGFSLLWSDEIVRHDAMRAVKRGFTFSEAEDFKAKAGLDFAQVKKHMGFRFSISGERRYVLKREFSPAPGLAGA